MFTALASILKEGESIDLEITGVGKDGRMKVIVKPKLAKGANPALAIPLALAATPQELDAEFVTTIVEFSSERNSLAEQVAVTTTILSAAKQAEVGKATKGLKGKAAVAGSAPAASSTEDSVDDGGDSDGDGDGDDVLDNNTGATAAPAVVPAKPATPAAAAPAGNDDLLSLI